ncbi:MAG TPA: PilZ domain-containing protein [Candidatus Acidoferrales bacterium]|nr:PilZ domain-containing protein [Candidatus Acidoferrales bacterium]
MRSTKPEELSLPAPDTTPERRRNLRFPFTATVEAIDRMSGTKVTGRTSDLSLGGCYVDTLSPLPIGTQATLRVQKGSETFEAQVKVIFSSIGMGMGLAFVSAQPKRFKIFQKWLLELSGQGVVEDDTHDASEVAPQDKSQTLKVAVLSDLIMTLMQKKVLTKDEGKDLLRKLFG